MLSIVFPTRTNVVRGRQGGKEWMFNIKQNIMKTNCNAALNSYFKCSACQIEIKTNIRFGLHIARILFKLCRRLCTIAEINMADTLPGLILIRRTTNWIIGRVFGSARKPPSFWQVI
jgi:hypothetical protein